MYLRRPRFLFFATILIAGCTSYQASAPVRDINIHQVGKIKCHLVQPEETLYAVAWRYEKDYRELAELNHLKEPYAIHPGELIQLNGVVKLISKPTVRQPKTVATKTVGVRLAKHVVSYEPAGKINHWIWPTKNHRISHGFSNVNKGIDISGNYGEPILAAAKGEVVYAGNGIRGYGNLLILKHNATYLTAYAYNDKLLVKEGQPVNAGQTIALMGTTNSGQVLLHFEIRKAGKPMDPLRYLRRA